MEYRQIGRTGLQAGVVGLGCEHLDGKPYAVVEETIHAALDNGINLMDLFMPGEEVRSNIGRALAGRRDRMMIQGHICSGDLNQQYDISRDPAVCRRYFETLLRCLRTDYIDFGMLFFVDSAADYSAAFESDILEYAQDLKRRGVIRAIGASSHNPVTARRIVESGVVDLLMFSINPAFDMMPPDSELEKMIGAPGELMTGMNPVRAELYRLCAAAEQLSEHPLGKAVTRCFRQETGGDIPAAGEFRMIPGRGVSAAVQGSAVLAGNREMLAEEGISLPHGAVEEAEGFRAKGCTVIFAAVNGVLAGDLALSDTVREESADMLRRLTQLGIHPVLLTGDHPDAASAIAGQLGIREVQANCLPEDKLRIIRGYQEKGEAVCMIGDGVNDAPALKAANVGVAMGGVGSAIAVDAADIALVDDEIKELPHLLALSRRMMISIKLNMTFSMALNFVAIVLAIIGTLSPVIGALVHNVGSVLVIINSALLLKWRKKEWLSTSSAR